jgi:hypothetical protein
MKFQKLGASVYLQRDLSLRKIKAIVQDVSDLPSVDGKENISRLDPRLRGAALGENVCNGYHGSRHLLEEDMI